MTPKNSDPSGATADGPIRLLSDHPPLLRHHRLQLVDTPERPLDQRPNDPEPQYILIIPGYDLSTGSDMTITQRIATLRRVATRFSTAANQRQSTTGV